MSKFTNYYQKGKELPTQKELKELFEYKEEDGTGKLFRIKAGKCTWIGQEVGTIHRSNPSRQEYQININKENYKLSRIIYAYHYGYFDPDLVIDHINGNSLDNRICNLKPESNLYNIHKGKAVDQSTYTFEHNTGITYIGRRVDFQKQHPDMTPIRVKRLFGKLAQPTVFGWRLA